MRSKVKKGYLRLTHINKSYKNVAVLKNLSLTIQEGEFIAIVGKSGCGKSTLLRLLSGLEKPDSGAIEISGNKLEKLNHESRLMFQDGRLLPWKTVGENVALGLTRESSKEVKEVLRSVDLDNRIHEWPEKLSGGQKQRVALARALIHKPRLLLLDEPLGALDALTRLDMQGLIEQIWLQKKFTALLVTHDVEEAVSLADRVIILKDGNTWRNRNSCTYYFKIKKNPPGKPLFLINGVIFIIISYIISWQIVVQAIICQWFSTKVIDWIFHLQVPPNIISFLQPQYRKK